jgi:hypothetical protein
VAQPSLPLEHVREQPGARRPLANSHQPLFIAIVKKIVLDLSLKIFVVFLFGEWTLSQRNFRAVSLDA